MPISADGRIQWLDRYGFGQHTKTIYNSVPSGPGGKRGKKGEIEEQENKEPEEENMEEVVEEDEEAVETAAAMRGGRDSNKEAATMAAEAMAEVENEKEMVNRFTISAVNSNSFQYC